MFFGGSRRKQSSCSRSHAGRCRQKKRLQSEPQPPAARSSSPPPPPPPPPCLPQRQPRLPHPVDVGEPREQHAHEEEQQVDLEEGRDRRGDEGQRGPRPHAHAREAERGRRGGQPHAGAEARAALHVGAGTWGDDATAPTSKEGAKRGRNGKKKKKRKAHQVELCRLARLGHDGGQPLRSETQAGPRCCCGRLAGRGRQEAGRTQEKEGGMLRDAARGIDRDAARRGVFRLRSALPRPHRQRGQGAPRGLWLALALRCRGRI